MPQARGPVFPMGGYSRIEQLLPGRSDIVYFPHHAVMLSFPAITLKSKPPAAKEKTTTFNNHGMMSCCVHFRQC